MVMKLDKVKIIKTTAVHVYANKRLQLDLFLCFSPLFSSFSSEIILKLLFPLSCALHVLEFIAGDASVT